MGKLKFIKPSSVGDSLVGRYSPSSVEDLVGELKNTLVGFFLGKGPAFQLCDQEGLVAALEIKWNCELLFVDEWQIVFKFSDEGDELKVLERNVFHPVKYDWVPDHCTYCKVFGHPSSLCLPKQAQPCSKDEIQQVNERPGSPSTKSPQLKISGEHSVLLKQFEVEDEPDHETLVACDVEDVDPTAGISGASNHQLGSTPEQTREPSTNLGSLINLTGFRKARGKGHFF
ncbi:hypothetical protein NE237_003155 [Protea cynaroides]|uniref:DUF4283 domain-containing protein n=1 Tax=Protea cynaroides TaxID=273540 RepID=A0A9Q0KGV7_9MAGN|nr:hypothetical protein NE237_003155 [Protea cynaroides]